MRRALPLAAALALGAGLAGCGFHLAGTRPLPPPLATVHIDMVQPYRSSEPPLETALRGILQRRGARVRGDAAGATVVRLSELREQRNVLSIGTDGKALEFQLLTSVRYEVLAEGQPLMPPDVLSVSREFSFNAQQVLAKEAEEARLREFIQNELAELLVLRIELVLANAGAGAGAP